MEPHIQAGAEAADQWLGQTWAASLAGALDSMTGEISSVEWMSEPAGVDSPAPAGQTLWWEQGFDLTPEPAVWVGVPEETWTEMARRALRAAGVEDGFYRSLVVERTPVHLRCRDGYEVPRAIVRDAGTYALLVETPDGLELFFKHAIISIRILPTPAAQA